MEQTPDLTPYKRPGDEGRRKPAVPLKKRPQFVADVKADVPRKDLMKTYKFKNERTMDGWRAWAKKIQVKLDAAAQS
jgi:hypothetical protein